MYNSMDDEEDLLMWVELRASRFYWLANMRQQLDAAAGNGGRIHTFLMSHLNELAAFKRAFVAGSSCPKDCRALCCFFSKEYENQLPVSNNERRLLDRVLLKEGRNPADYYTFVPVEKVSADVNDYLSGMPGFIFTRNGVTMVCMLNPSHTAVKPELLKDLPKTGKRFRRMWVKPGSNACRFLSDEGSCTLYKRVRFTVCREFYCLTAIAVIALINLGLADASAEASIMKKPLRTLNALADKIALEFRSRGFLTKEKEYDSMVRELALAHLRGEETESRYKKLRKFEKDYDKKLKDSLKAALETS